jgi:hypothetical protein
MPEKIDAFKILHGRSGGAYALPSARYDTSHMDGGQSGSWKRLARAVDSRNRTTPAPSRTIPPTSRGRPSPPVIGFSPGLPPSSVRDGDGDGERDGVRDGRVVRDGERDGVAERDGDTDGDGVRLGDGDGDGDGDDADGDGEAVTEGLGVAPGVDGSIEAGASACTPPALPGVVAFARTRKLP